MEIAFISRTLILTMSLALLTSLSLLFFHPSFDVLGIIAGSLWGCGNLLLIQQVTKTLLLQKNPHPITYFLLFLVKFPLIYGAGYCLLEFTPFPALFTLGGFSLLFVAIFLIGMRMWVEQNVH